MIQRIGRYLDRFPYWQSTLLLAIIANAHKIIALVLVSVAMLISQDARDEIAKLPEIYVWDGLFLFTALVTAPITETLVAQLLIIWLGLKVGYFRKYPLLIILVSTILFAFMHSGFSTMANAFYVGLVLAYATYHYLIRGDWVRACWTTVFIHFFSNLFAYGFRVLIA
ncbi:MAG: CPBP family intramembrane metalloprotease [Chitinophagales bacterium]|nr:CPBP family intramembrane metalloprotease [Chitinophagaceae bacterium]MCB9065672.1 CPBP family intramembrane metalloprotease [Chitinophagales bacterium]